jgi:hypothetical protein
MSASAKPRTPMLAYACRMRGPQRPISFIVGTMRVKRLVRKIAISSERATWSVHSSTGSPRVSARQKLVIR